MLVVGMLVGGRIAQAQQGRDAARVSVEVLAGLTGGTVGGLFGATGGQTLGDLLPGSAQLWTFAATLTLHNAGTTLSSAAAYRLVEGRRALYSDARKGAMLGDAALLVYAAVASPLLSRVGCGVGSWCGKTFGIAAHFLPAIGASVAIERAR